MALNTKPIVFIATAQVYVKDSEGNTTVCRAMLDPGSQSNIITKRALNKLKLKRRKTKVSISGISLTQAVARKSITIKIKSMYNDFSEELNCLVMPTITEKLPHIKIRTHIWNIPESINLARVQRTINNRHTHRNSIFWKVMCSGQRTLSEALPKVTNTARMGSRRDRRDSRRDGKFKNSRSQASFQYCSG